MDSKGLKFLLKLLSFDNYRAPLSHVKPTPKMKAAERNKICQQLRDLELVDCSEEIQTLTASAKGQSLLDTDQPEVYLTPDELTVLHRASKPISPGKTGLAPAVRSPILEQLASRELLTLETHIKEVWLTERGKKFLIEDYDPTSHSGSLSFQMLADYLQLIRQSHRQKAVGATAIEQPVDFEKTETTRLPKKLDRPATNDNIACNLWQTIRQLDLHLQPVSQVPSQLEDRELLEIIHQLDQELVTEGYLPIFNLREKISSSLSREDLDRALYRLHAQAKIDLKSLEEVLHYSPEYFEASIARPNQWSLFFIVLR